MTHQSAAFPAHRLCDKSHFRVVYVTFFFVRQVWRCLAGYKVITRRTVSSAAVGMRQGNRMIIKRYLLGLLLLGGSALSVADTAAAMGCSQGSVKTHLSRAHAALRAELEDHWT